MTETQANYDSPLKEALEQYFEAFLAFFFPQAYREIDWEYGYEFLEQELQQEDNLYRVRSGDYRIIYKMQDDILLILVAKVGHRRDVYK